MTAEMNEKLSLSLQYTIIRGSCTQDGKLIPSPAF